MFKIHSPLSINPNNNLNSNLSSNCSTIFTLSTTPNCKEISIHLIKSVKSLSKLSNSNLKKSFSKTKNSKKKYSSSEPGCQNCIESHILLNNPTSKKKNKPSKKSNSSPHKSKLKLSL